MILRFSDRFQASRFFREEKLHSPNKRNKQRNTSNCICLATAREKKRGLRNHDHTRHFENRTARREFGRIESNFIFISFPKILASHYTKPTSHFLAAALASKTCSLVAFSMICALNLCSFGGVGTAFACSCLSAQRTRLVA